jgi:hypothetical protein
MALLGRLQGVKPRGTERESPMSAIDAVDGSSTERRRIEVPRAQTGSVCWQEFVFRHWPLSPMLIALSPESRAAQSSTDFKSSATASNLATR